MAVSFQLLRSSTASKRPQASSLSAGELGLNFNDSTSGLFYENASGNVMKVGPTEVSATAPNASPASGGSSGNSKGELWYDTGNSILKVYDGSSFVASANVTTITGVTAGTVSASKAVIVDSNKDITGFRNITATGDVTVPEGDLILGSTAVTSTAAEINTLDGVTAGTVTASKALIVDSNKDLASLRNLTLTGDLTVPEGDLVLGSAAVTSTAAELNILDGATVTTTELNILDGATVTTTELNYVDGVTSAIQTQLDAKQATDAELTELATMTSGTASALADLTQTEVQILDGATVTTAELNTLDGVTAGTVTASKAVIVDANKDIASFRNVTLTGELDVATLDVSSTSDFAGDVTFSTAQDISIIDNTAQALRILGGGTELIRVTTTDGGEKLDVSTTTMLDGAVDINGAVDVAGQITFSAAQALLIPDNSGTALRVLEGTNEYMRFTTTDGSEKIQTTKELEVNGALNIDGDVDCSGSVTFSAAQTISIPDNTGFGLRISSDGTEYVRFTTTDGAEVVDFSKAVKLDGGLTLGSGISVPASQDITLVSNNSNAIDFVIDGGNRMMRFNTSTETVLMEQNIDVGGTANFDEVDIDSTVDIAGGPVTFSANSKINVPDNAASAFKVQQGDAEPIISIATTDALPTVTFDYRVIFDEDISFTGSQHLFMTDNLADAFSISEATNDYMVFATSNSGPKITTKKDLVQTPSSSVTPANNGELTVAATDNTTITFSLKGSDGTVRTGTITLS